VIDSKKDARQGKRGKVVKFLDKYRRICNMLDLWNKLLVKYFFNSVLNLVDRINLRHFRLQPSMFLYTLNSRNTYRILPKSRIAQSGGEGKYGVKEKTRVAS
jgi:hypothetical protein